jgi:hypothetical protein
VRQGRWAWYSVTPASLRRSVHGLLLPPDRLAVLSHFGRCHGHRFGQLDGAGLPVEEELCHRDGAAAITHAIVGRRGEQASGNASK